MRKCRIHVLLVCLYMYFKKSHSVGIRIRTTGFYEDNRWGGPLGKAVLSEAPCHSRYGTVQKLKFYIIKIRSYTRPVFISYGKEDLTLSN